MRTALLVLFSLPVTVGCVASHPRPVELLAPAVPALEIASPREAAAPVPSTPDYQERSDVGVLRAADLGNATGYTIGVAGQQTRVEAQFDGDEALVGPNDVIVIPDLDSETGYKASVGYRWKRHAFELSFESTDHDGEFGGLPADTVFYSINASWKEYFWVRGFLQPYALFGLGVVRATIEDGSSDGMSLQDADLDGVQLQFGAGLALFLLRHLSVDVYGIYRFVRFMEADGVGGDLSIDENLEGDSWILGLGVTLIF